MPERHALLGASSAHRWLECPPSARMTEFLPGTTSPYAEEGTKAHALCEKTLRLNLPRWARGETDVQLPDNDCPAEMQRTATAYAEFVFDQWSMFPHIPGAFVEQEVDFSRWVPGGFGTADCILAGDGVLHVIDYKHGAGVPVSPVENDQMKLYALGAYAMFEIIEDISTVRMSIVQPRIQAEPETWEIPLEQLLDEAQKRIKPLAQLAWEGKGNLNPGEKQCRWCRAYPRCKAWEAKFGPLADFKPLPDPQIMNDQELGAWLSKLQGLPKYVKDLEEAAHAALLRGETIPGWKLIEGRSTRAWTDQPAAFQAMQASGISDSLLYERTPISLTAAEKLMGKKAFAEVCGSFTCKPAGAPKLAPESDKHPAYNPTEGFEAVT